MGVFEKLMQAPGGKSAQQMLLELAVTKICENLPPDAIDNIRKIAETIAGFKAQLERIEAGQLIITQRLNFLHDAVGELSDELSNRTGTGISQTDHAGEQPKA